MPALPFVDSPAGGILGYSPGAAQSVGDTPAQNPGGDGMSGPQNSQVGTGDLTADYNTPLHVGGLILIGLGITIALKYMGFRFAVDVGVGK